MFIQNEIIGTQKIDKNIIELLDEDQANEDFILEKFKQADSVDNETIYVKLLKILTHLDFSLEEAKKIWQDIQENQKELSEKVGRDIGFRVAMLDYFINVNKKIKNPKIIEIKLYVETEKLILLDELTGLYNRRYFNHCLEREGKQATRYGRSFSFMILDIDNFKSINDLYGHAKGDWVLEKLGEILRSNTRVEDSACRIGGEEFALLLPDTNTEDAKLVSDKIQSAFSSLVLNGRSLSLSGGIATFPDDADDFHQLMDIADRLLYFAKYSGKNKVISASEEKRTEHRFNTKWNISYKILERKYQTTSEDISIIGVSFEVESNLRIGDIISLDLKNEKDKNSMNMKAKVVWKEKIENSVKIRVGAKFLGLQNAMIHQIKRELEVS